MSTYLTSFTRRQAFVRGLLATILGIVFIIWPGITIGTAVVLFAIYAFADAVMQLTLVFGAVDSGGRRFLRVLAAIADIAAAVIAIGWPGPTAAVLVLIIGFWAIFVGCMELFAAFDTRSGWLGVNGVLSIGAGIVLTVWPDLGAVSLALVVGFYLAAYGVVLLVSAAKAPHGSRVPDPLTAA